MNLFQYMKNPLTGDKLLQYAKEAILENEHILMDILQHQWEDGEDKLGRIIGRYKKRTQLIAELSSPPPNRKKIWGHHYNLNWTGDLIKKLVIEVYRKSNDLSIKTDSNSDNKQKLFKTIRKHGSIKNPEQTVIGYQKENLRKFKELVKQELINKIKIRHGL